MANIKHIMTLCKLIVYKSPLLQNRATKTIDLLVTILFILISVAITILSVENLYLLMQLVYQKLFIKHLGSLLSDPTCCVVLFNIVQVEKKIGEKIMVSRNVSAKSNETR